MPRPSCVLRFFISPCLHRRYMLLPISKAPGRLSRSLRCLAGRLALMTPAPTAAPCASEGRVVCVRPAGKGDPRSTQANSILSHTTHHAPHTLSSTPPQKSHGWHQQEPAGTEGGWWRRTGKGSSRPKPTPRRRCAAWQGHRPRVAGCLGSNDQLGLHRGAGDRGHCGAFGACDGHRVFTSFAGGGGGGPCSSS